MFIAVDLKVIEGLAGAVARSSGVSEEAVGWGLVRLWHRCWSDEIDHLDRSELAGIFGLQNLDLVTNALEAFGFLEAQKIALSWRVKGASRYLRLKESRRRGAVATNTQKARSKAAGSDAQTRSRASLSDAQTRSLTESPNTESPSTTKTAGKKPPAADKAPDPRHAPLVKALTAEGYDFDGGKDAKQVALLLAKGEPAEVVRRYLRARSWPLAFPRVRTLTELVAMWPHFAEDAPVKVGPVGAETQTHTRTGEW